MRNFTIYVAGLLCFFLADLHAQDTFESRAKAIANKIEQITKEEKEALKTEVATVNERLANNQITVEEAELQKSKLAETRAKNIESRTAGAQEQLRLLVQDQVDGNINDNPRRSKRFIFAFENGTSDTAKACKPRVESRTTSQFVFAAGLNNLETDKSVAHSDFRTWGSHFYEWGFTFNTRVFKNDNLLHAKYGLSLMYNNLRPTENRVFATSGDETMLSEYGIHLEDSRFRTVNLVVPVHLEFDFSGNKSVDGNGFRTHQSFRFGIGGYAGANLKAKQIVKYETGDHNVRARSRGDFNVNTFVYGVSTYIGYKETSLYLKYDLNPLFENNGVDQRNISLGLRFDIN